jgi:hypothetical protein
MKSRGSKVALSWHPCDTSVKTLVLVFCNIRGILGQLVSKSRLMLLCRGATNRHPRTSRLLRRTVQNSGNTNCYIVVALLSHCCYTVVTLFSRCCHTVDRSYRDGRKIMLTPELSVGKRERGSEREREREKPNMKLHCWKKRTFSVSENTQDTDTQPWNSSPCH